MRDAVIVSSVRTAAGKAPRGTLRYTRPDDMGAVALKAALAAAPGVEAESASWAESTMTWREPKHASQITPS